MEVQAKLVTRISHINLHLCKWLHEAWQHVFTQPDLILKGWVHAGLMRTFIHEFQLEVVEKNSTTPLFKPTIVELKNKNLAIALDIDLVVSSNNDTEEDSSIDTTMDSDDDYDIEDSIDQVM
jgi:hypothetical protein